MVKPILVPTPALCVVAAGLGGGVEPPSNANVNKGPSAKTEQGKSDSEANSVAIDFNDVFSELRRYKQENSGRLSIPASHPALSRIIDSLSESSEGMESLSNKRWENQLAALKLFKENHGDVDVPPTHPTLGNWLKIQRKHYQLYEQRMPNALTKKRFGKLKAIGLGGEEKSQVKAEDDVNSLQSKSAKLEEDASQSNYKKDAAPNGSKQKTMKPKIENSEKGNDESKMAPVHDIAIAIKGGKLKGKCDICEKKDKYLGHNLQKCKECHVLVHELCYGMPETDCKDPNFVCHACRAVGTEVEVNAPSKIGGCGKKMGEKRELITQKQRPTECVLCTHDKGIHAMHPLLDTHGQEGRQLVWNGRDGGKGKGGDRKLAWVHTLCAAVICANPQTKSSVYGCDQDGNYHGDEEDSCGSDECIDEDNGNAKESADGAKSASHDADEESSKGDGSCTSRAISSYVIASEEIYAKNIRDHRNLKCFLCGKKDKTWRFPVQCACGDEFEHGRWKNRHRKGTEPCCVAVHVGCARWGCIEPEGSHLEIIDGKRCKLCYFTPGRYYVDGEASKNSNEDEENETVAHCYCKAHARDIVVNNPNRKNKSGNAVGSSNAGKVKTEPNRGPRARPQKKLPKPAQSSFKKSINSIRSRGGNKNVSLKRKSSTLREGVFGATKKTKVEFMEESSAQFPVRGRSAGALSLLSSDGRGQPSEQMNPRAAPASNHASGVAPSILRVKKDPAVLNGSSGQLTGKRMHSLVPDLPSSGTSCEKDKSVTFNDSAGRVSGKRKARPVQDLPTGGRFKRVKMEDYLN